MTNESNTDIHIMICDGSQGTISETASEYARSAGHAVNILTFPGNPSSHHQGELHELDLDHLKEANRYILRANKNMHRSWPKQQLSQDNALRRDVWVTRWTHNLYVFGLFTQDASLLKINSDACWIAQMYVDRFLFDKEPMDLCHIYMFDMKSESWWQWRQQWNMISKPVPPDGIYTIVSQEKLTNAAKVALKDLWPVSQ